MRPNSCRARSSSSRSDGAALTAGATELVVVGDVVVVVVVDEVPPSRWTVGVAWLPGPPDPARLVWTTGSLVIDRCGNTTVVPGALQSGVPPVTACGAAGAAGLASGIRIAGVAVRAERWTAGVVQVGLPDGLRSGAVIAGAGPAAEADVVNAERWTAGPPPIPGADGTELAAG
jgi:hypothetical protein